MIFDWAGTTVDFGCLAPVAAFREIFARAGAEVTEEQIRGPMGKGKRDHVAAMLADAGVRAAWRDRFGREPGEADVDRLYDDYGTVINGAIAAHAGLIPGVVETVAVLRARGLAIGSTTGYVRAMMTPLLASAAAAGYEPDVTVCSDEVPAGRPAPWMIFEAMRQLDVYPPRAVVKVGDTVQDVEEALNAGAWAVGVVASGNLVGLSAGAWVALSPAERAERLAAGRDQLLRAGAHRVIDSVVGLPAVVDELDGLAA